jgi:hypothetical protein
MFVFLVLCLVCGYIVSATFCKCVQRPSHVLSNFRSFTSTHKTERAVLLAHKSRFTQYVHLTFDQSCFSSHQHTTERAVLLAHKSRFTQFLVFYVCSLEHRFADRFLHRLLEVVNDRGTLCQAISCCFCCCFCFCCFVVVQVRRATLCNVISCCALYVV